MLFRLARTYPVAKSLPPCADITRGKIPSALRGKNKPFITRKKRSRKGAFSFINIIDVRLLKARLAKRTYSVTRYAKYAA